MPSAASASWNAARCSGSSSTITPSKSKMSARGPRGMGASYSGAGDAGQPRRGSIQSPRQMTSWRFAARQRFAREPLGPPRPFTGVVVTDPVFTVEAAPLDHKIVSMAYAMTERTHLNVRPEALAAAGLEPGPWLNALKQAIRTGAPDDTPIQVTPGDRRPLGALSAELITVTPGQKVAYVVDTLFSPANAAAIVRLAAGADLFFCEAPFLEEDLEQAARRYHLTARQAGALGRAAGPTCWGAGRHGWSRRRPRTPGRSVSCARAIRSTAAWRSTTPPPTPSSASSPRGSWSGAPRLRVCE